MQDPGGGLVADDLADRGERDDRQIRARRDFSELSELTDRVCVGERESAQERIGFEAGRPSDVVSGAVHRDALQLKRRLDSVVVESVSREYAAVDVLDGFPSELPACLPRAEGNGAPSACG